jgi:ribulose-5-phosphate 4-epimerase/fuculose-1-phosphate aldolase
MQHLNVNRDEVLPKIHAEEWRARVELAAFYRVVSQLQMTDLIYNHITVRVPGTRDQFLINPFGLDYAEITASSLVKIDLEGRIVLPSPTGYGVNPAGFVIHSAIHAARHDVECVAHTHTSAGVAVSSLKCGLLPLNQNALRFTGDLAYHEYEGVVLQEEEKASLVADLGNHYSMILRNHGLLVCGRSIAEAYVNLWCLETACRMQVQTLSCGREVNTVSEAALRSSEAVYATLRKGGMDNYAGPALEWAAARRMLDKFTTDYMN